MLKWTFKKPTESGYYWFMETNKYGVTRSETLGLMVVRVANDDIVFIRRNFKSVLWERYCNDYSSYGDFVVAGPMDLEKPEWPDRVELEVNIEDRKRCVELER